MYSTEIVAQEMKMLDSRPAESSPHKAFDAEMSEPVKDDSSDIFKNVPFHLDPREDPPF